jgi:hypothetical protein
MADRYTGPPIRGEGTALPLPPTRTLTIRYTDGCIIYGMVGADDPLIIDGTTEAIIDIPAPVRLVLGPAHPAERERYRGA